MPVEIRELVIRAVVKDEQAQAGDDAATARNEPQNQQAIIEECVKQVLKILKRKQAR